MHVAHYLKWMRLSDGGTVRAVLDWCGALAAKGHRVTLLTADAADVPASWKGPQGVQHPGGGSVRCELLRVEDRLAALISGRGRHVAPGAPDSLGQLLDTDSMRRAKDVLATVDCLHLHGVWASSNAQLGRVMRQLKRRYVISPHGMLDDWSMSQGRAKKRLHQVLISGKLIRSASRVLCTAQGELDQVSKHITLGSGRVVPLLFDTGPFQHMPSAEEATTTLALKPETPVILFLSRIHIKKGPERLLRSAAILRERGVKFQLILAGPPDPPDYQAELESLSRELGLADTARFVGMVTGTLKLSLYRASSLFVLPTSQENFGFVLLEALAAGVPTITTNGVDLWRELEQSGGAVISESEPNALATAMEKLLGDEPARSQMSVAGRSWALSWLKPSAVIQAYEEIYAGRA